PAPSADQKRSSWSSARHETAPEAGCLKAMAQAAGLPPERQCCSCACGTPWVANRAPLPPAGRTLPVSSFHLLIIFSLFHIGDFCVGGSRQARPISLQ